MWSTINTNVVLFILESTIVILHAINFNIKEFCSLFTEYIYVLCMILIIYKTIISLNGIKWLVSVMEMTHISYVAQLNL
jgi:hypothetical protein